MIEKKYKFLCFRNKLIGLQSNFEKYQAVFLFKEYDSVQCFKRKLKREIKHNIKHACRMRDLLLILTGVTE